MITNTTSKVVYSGDGTTKQFQVTFPFTDNDELQLFLQTISTGEKDEISTNWSYDNGYITYPVTGLAIPDTKQIIIQRNTPITQEKDHDVRLFTSEDVEGMADKLTRIAQELKRDSEVNAQKQDQIPDLDEIRSNAAAGKSAKDAVDVMGNIVSHDADEFASVSELATVATSGDYQDLNNKPTIPTVNNATITFTQGGTTKGSFTLNQSSNQTIALEAGGGGGGGAVDSVNGKTGTVVLTASDVGAASASSLSDYRTSAAQDVIDNSKQDAISDLETIRSGAALGATAVQPAALSTKQDTLVSGTNIKTVNGSSLLGSGNVNVATVPLFYHTFADHLFSDTSWLRADTFSWQDGAVYVSAYNHLVADISGITSETETISGTTITFYRADDGHKIVLADQESNVSAIYTATGVAWYYVLDTANTRFKLPRILPLADTAPVVGNGMTLGLTNGTDNLGPSTLSGQAIYGGFGVSTEFYGKNIGTQGTLTYTYDGSVGVTTDSTKSGLIANLSHTSNDGAYKYLYFYVGNTVQGQTTIDVGQITEDLNGKADLDLSNVPASKGILVESYANGASWYRVYSDGWCEQGGVSSGTADVGYSASIVFVKQFANSDYTLLTQAGRTNNDTSYINNQSYVYSKSATGFSAVCYGDGVSSFISWEAKGYLPSES